MAAADLTIHNNTPRVVLSAVECFLDQVSDIPVHQRDLIMDPPKFAASHNYF